MTEKRFRKGYVLGDTGLINEQKGEWFIENINNVSDLEKNWNKVIDKLNEVADENRELQEQFQEQERRKWACLKEAHLLDLENKQLKQKLRLYKELYPTGKWITELTTEELEKEFSE